MFLKLLTARIAVGDGVRKGVTKRHFTWEVGKHCGRAIRTLCPSLTGAKLRRAVGNGARRSGENSVTSRSPWEEERFANELGRLEEDQESVQKRQGRGLLRKLQGFDRFGHAAPEAGVDFGGIGVGNAQREHDVGSV